MHLVIAWVLKGAFLWAGQTRLVQVPVRDAPGTYTEFYPKLTKANRSRACTELSVIPARQYKIAVSNNHAHVKSVRVYMADGTNKLLHVNRSFNVGESTEWFKVSGEIQCLVGLGVLGETNSGGEGKEKEDFDDSNLAHVNLVIGY